MSSELRDWSRTRAPGVAGTTGSSSSSGQYRSAHRALQHRPDPLRDARVREPAGGVSSATPGTWAFHLKGDSPPNVTLAQICNGMMPYILIVIVCVVIMYPWPGMTLSLPKYPYGAG